MRQHLLYVIATSVDRAQPYYQGGRVNMVWSKRILANNRTEAVEKVLPEIGNLIDTITDPTIKYVSVWCGLTAKDQVGQRAERLNPIQVEVSTKQIRKRL